jgi:hypothetical protein
MRMSMPLILLEAYYGKSIDNRIDFFCEHGHYFFFRALPAEYFRNHLGRSK